ncbi:MAG: hypothetical protein EBR30_06430 [Cytophagia bacterium]|nr:hypothetical protein [Cytophagia bacterium]
MKNLNRSLYPAYLLLLTLSACSILKSDDPEKNVRTFLTSFQDGLNKTDDDILSVFRVEQSREALLEVIGILQNKDPFIVSTLNMAGAEINIDQEVVTVQIPVSFRVKELESTDSSAFTLRMWLKPADDSFIITYVNGEEFYQAFQEIKNRNQWEAAEILAAAERKEIYETARSMREKYDSVIWYASHEGEHYFYVVSGAWQNYFMEYSTRDQQNENVRMGLADASGELIIPIDYDLIGTIGFEKPNLVEVTRDGKYGYYDVVTMKEVVEPVYDLIIPYNAENAWALVKKDTAFGWLDDAYQYTPGFASAKMEAWFNNFDYLKQEIRLVPDNYTFCEIPDEKFAGNGIIIPPAYFSKNGIFPVMESGFSTTEVPINGWTEYKEVSGSFIESIGNNLRAIVTTIKERYLEGREEFYTSSQLTFVDTQLNTLSTATISGEDVSLRSIDSTLLEVRTPHDYWFMENEASEEQNLLSHSYFYISPEKSITELKSKRLYPQTEFVKLDSSYLTGNFKVYSNDAQDWEERDFLSAYTLNYMRDEILAANGLRFDESSANTTFNYLQEGKEVSDNREAAIAAMNEIDRYNYEFLSKILALMQPQV